MTISYNSCDTFHAGILACVKHGLMFRADHATLTIHLTGGF